MDISSLEMHPDFDFDVDLLAYQQDDMYLPLHHGQFTASDGIETHQKVVSRISLACVPCRSRHVKCNAGAPSCSRCQSVGRSCSYAKSKRGARSTVPRGQTTSRTNWLPGVDEFNQSQYQAVDNMVPVSNSSGATPETTSTTRSHNSFHDGNDCSLTQLLDLYYANFHDAHPILLPRSRFLSRLQSNPVTLRHLIPVMKYIGSLYLPDTPSETLKEEASSALLADDFPSTGFSVQALMLFGIAMHCCNHTEEGKIYTFRAVNMVLEIRMCSKLFALENGEGDAVLEDSWRRTWWLLYVIDGTMSGIRRDKVFKLSHVYNDVDMPCEEKDYIEGVIPPPKSLEEYDTREFADEEIVFSSFTYLIDAARIIGAILPTLGEANFDIDVTNIDARIVNWSAHLPDCKKEMISTSQDMDEMMFQAYMLINIIKLYLHRPRSYLTYNYLEETSRCTLGPPIPQAMMKIGQSVQAFHTYKTLEALEALLGMMTLPTPILKHTPLVSCAIANGIMGQISACVLVLADDKVPEARERIRLGIGALKSFAEVWPASKQTMFEMKAMARDILNIRITRGNETSPGDIAAGPGLSCGK